MNRAFVVRRDNMLLTAPPMHRLDMRRSLVAFVDYSCARKACKHLSGLDSIGVFWTTDGSLMLTGTPAKKTPSSSVVTNIKEVDMDEEAIHCSHTAMDVFMACELSFPTNKTSMLHDKNVILHGFVASTSVQKHESYNKFVLDHYFKEGEVRSLSSVKSMFEFQ